MIVRALDPFLWSPYISRHYHLVRGRQLWTCGGRRADREGGGGGERWEKREIEIDREKKELYEEGGREV